MNIFAVSHWSLDLYLDAICSSWVGEVLFFGGSGEVYALLMSLKRLLMGESEENHVRIVCGKGKTLEAALAFSLEIPGKIFHRKISG